LRNVPEVANDAIRSVGEGNPINSPFIVCILVATRIRNCIFRNLVRFTGLENAAKNSGGLGRAAFGQKKPEKRTKVELHEAGYIFENRKRYGIYLPCSKVRIDEKDAQWGLVEQSFVFGREMLLPALGFLARAMQSYVRFDTGSEFAGAERFDEIVVRTRLNAFRGDSLRPRELTKE
jgi:hypothetical protein